MLSEKKVSFHLPEWLFARVAQDAAENGRSVAAQLRFALARYYHEPIPGRHAPGHLRESFCDLVDTLHAGGDIPSTTTVAGEQRPVEWLLQRLEASPDCMPSDACSDLELSPGCTYAEGVAKFREWLEAEKKADVGEQS